MKRRHILYVKNINIKTSNINSTGLRYLNVLFCFVLTFYFVSTEFGNAWANENIFTVAEAIVWFRYHNYVATQLNKEHPSWSDEELFQNARKRVIATFQVRRKVTCYLETTRSIGKYSFVSLSTCMVASHTFCNRA